MTSTSILTRAFIVSAIVASVTFPGAATASAYTGPSDDEPPLCSALTLTDYNEILWLSRVIYSETKNPAQMRLIAWVVRNRVDTKYHGTTYEEVATSKNQFSGLNPNDPQYGTNIHMGENGADNLAWRTATHIASEVYYAPANKRPFSPLVRHFYSPSAMSEPSWAKSGTLAMTASNQFAFYRGVK